MELDITSEKQCMADSLSTSKTFFVLIKLYLSLAAVIAIMWEDGTGNAREHQKKMC